MPRFDENDADVVVVVGSGAGGGTLANELCQGGVKTVVLEAGAHHKPDDFIDDEWPSFGQLAWLDERTTSGSWRVATDFPSLPAWTCKTVGGTSVHWAGCCPRFKDWEFRNRSEHGADRRHEHARLAHRAGRRRALLRPRRGQARRHAHQRHPAAARQQQLQGDGQRRQARRLQGRQHRAHGDQLRAARRAPGDDPGRLQLPGRPPDGALVDADRRAAEGRGDRQARPAALQPRLPHRPQRRRQGQRRALLRRRRQRARAEGARGVRGRQRDRDGAAAAALRLAAASRRPRELVGAGRAQLHAPPDGLGLRRVRQAGADVPRRDDVGDHHRRGAQRPRPRLHRRLLHAAARPRAAVLRRLPGPRRMGPGLRGADGGLRARGRDVARRRGHAAGVQPRDAQPRRDRPARPARAQRPLRRPPQRRRDARARLPGRRVGLRARSTRSRSTA